MIIARKENKTDEVTKEEALELLRKGHHVVSEFAIRQDSDGNLIFDCKIVPITGRPVETPLIDLSELAITMLTKWRINK